MRVAAPTTPTAPTPTAPTAITTGTLIARGTDRAGAPVEIIAGRILETGVTDIRETGWDLIRATHDHPFGGNGSAWGTVAFVRAGDAWTAVELLTKSAAKTEALWTPSGVTGVRVAAGVAIDAIWQVSHYGGDYSDMAREWLAPGPGVTA